MGLLECLAEYRYDREPEGKDPLGKLVGLCKYGMVAGLMASTVDSCMLEPVRPTIAAVANNVAFWTIPLTSMCAAFASTAYMAADLRKKDDTWNYVLGSLAVGGVCQAWQKNATISMVVMFSTMIYSVGKKEIEMNGGTIINPKLKRNHGIWWDYTYTTDPRSTGWEPRNRRFL